jgi:hypothetical protein
MKREIQIAFNEFKVILFAADNNREECAEACEEIANEMETQAIAIREELEEGQ